MIVFFMASNIVKTTNNTGCIIIFKQKLYSTVNNQCCELVFNKTICCIFMIVEYGNVVYFGHLNICL